MLLVLADTEKREDSGLKKTKKDKEKKKKGKEEEGEEKEEDDPDNDDLRPRKHVIFRYHWRRVILDEATIIKNVHTSNARAVKMLKKTFGWAVSGGLWDKNIMNVISASQFINGKNHNWSNKTYIQKHVDDRENLWNKLCILINTEGDEQYDKIPNTLMWLKRDRCLMKGEAGKSIEIENIEFELAEKERQSYDVIRKEAIDAFKDINNPQLTALTGFNDVRVKLNKLRMLMNNAMQAHVGRTGSIGFAKSLENRTKFVAAIMKQRCICCGSWFDNPQNRKTNKDGN